MESLEHLGKWFQLIARAPADRADELGAWLLGAGAAGLETLDENNPEPLADLPAGWVELRASFEAGAGADPEELTAALGRELARIGPEAGKDPPPAWLSWLDAQDWTNNWKAHFAPVRVGRFEVHPGWEPPSPEARWSVQIDPGLAFGTGMHPTTRLCLAALDDRIAGPGLSVLDVGCGSGVLAVAAAMAGASPVVAVDNDPEACRVTLENAALNGQAERIQVHLGGPAVTPGAFDLVMANILSGTLIALRGELSSRVAAGGWLVLSGILAEEADWVAEVFSGERLAVLRRRDREGWSALTLADPAAPGARP